MTEQASQEQPVIDTVLDPESGTAVAVDEARLHKLLKYHIWASAGVGLLPLPVVDLVGVTALQVNLLRKLAEVYHVPFSQNLGKSLVGALMGGVLPTGVAGPVMRTVKMVPVVGTVLGVLTMPALAAASTYALGKVFNQHFASGGTLLTFNPAKVKDYYRKMFKEGLAKTQEAAPAAA